MGKRQLDVTEGELSLYGRDFVDDSSTYEMSAVIYKDTRKKRTFAHLIVVPYSVPILTVRCLTKEFCIPYDDGVYINPSYQVNMVMQCSDECSYIREYKWILSTADDEEIPYQDKYFPF
ncbi:hypothetical protein SK128_013686, partial [Halocaridina rubra]